MLRWLALILFLPSLALAVHTDTLRGTTATFDTELRQAAATTNYGTATTISVDKTTGSQRRMMIAVDSTSFVNGFDLDGQILSAKLWVYCTAEVNATLSLYEAAKPLKEASATWNGWSGADTNWAELGGDETGTITAAAQNRGKWAHIARDYKYPTLASGWLNGSYLQTNDATYARFQGVAGIYAFASDFNYALPTGAVIDSLGFRVDACYDDVGALIDDSYFAFAYVDDEMPVIGDRLGDTAWIGTIEASPCTTYCWNDPTVGTPAECYRLYGPNGGDPEPRPLWHYTWTPALINDPYWGVLIGPKKSSGADGTDSLIVDYMQTWVEYQTDTALDRAATAMSTASVTSTGWVSFDLDTAWVRDIYTGTKHCYGLFIIATTGDGVTTFTSSEGTAAYTPMIVIQDADGASVIWDDTDIPYTTTATYDTIVVAADSIIADAAGAAITMGHDHAYLDLNGNTLFVGQVATNGFNKGVSVEADTCTIRNGTLEQHSTSTNDSLRIIELSSSIRHLYIDTVNIHARGFESGGIYGPGASEVRIYGGNLTSYVNDFSTRESAYTAPIYLMDEVVAAQTAPQQFRYWVSHITIDSCPHSAVQINGGTLHCDSNIIRVDAQNHYTYQSANMMQGTSNAYAIALDRIGTGCTIYGNTVRSGVNHEGGRGIILHGQAAYTTNHSIEVAYNDDSTHVGPDAYYGLNEQGVSFRVKDTGTDTLYVHHNTFITVADTSYATEHTGTRALGIWLTDHGHHWRFEYNTIKAIGVPGLYGYRSTFATCGIYGDPFWCGTYARAVCFDGMNVSDSVIFRNNHIESNVIPVNWGETNSSGTYAGERVYFYGDTVIHSTTNYADEWGNDAVVEMCLQGGDSRDNYMTDVVFQQDTVPLQEWDGTIGELTLRKTLRVNVLDSLAADVEGARVRVRNAYGTALLVDTTNATGDIDSVEAAFRRYQTGVPSDSTYNPFYIDVITNLDETPPDSVTESYSFGLSTSGDITIIVAPTSGSTISLSTPVLLGTGTVYDAIAIPRDKAVAQDGRLHFFPGTGGDIGNCGTCTREYYSTDSGVTWTGINPSIDAGAEVNYHLAVFGQSGRGIHLAVPDDAQSSRFSYRFLDNPGTALGDMNDQRLLSAGGTTRGTVAARGDTVWGIWRYTGDLDSLGILMSVDTFKTTVGDYGKNVGGAANNHRIGVFTDDNGLPVLFWHKYATGNYMLPWHGLEGDHGRGFYGNNDSVITTDIYNTPEGVDRDFTIVYADDSWHFIYGTESGATDHLIHCRDTGSTPWFKDTITTSTVLGYGTNFAPKAGVRNDSIFLAYGTAATGGTATAFALKIFDPVTDTWSDSTWTLGGGHTFGGSVQIPSRIPTTFNFVPYFFVVNGSPDSVYFGKIQLSGDVNDPPVVSGFIDSTIAEGASFGTLALDNYVTDPDNADADISWSSYTIDATDDFTVSIVSRVATISAATSDSYGTDTIVFRAEDPSSAADEDTVIYTITAVNDAPVVSGIPDQGITVGSVFATITLDNYVTDVDNTDAQMTWTYSGNTNLGVSIVSRVATITNTNPLWTGAENITFRATDPGALYDDDVATFTVNAAPVEWHKVKGLKRGHKP